MSIDIPSDIPRRINKSLKDVKSLSVVYTPRVDSYIEQTDGSILVPFPYSKNTFWTNFKCFTSYKLGCDGLKSKIVLITTNNYIYTLNSINKTMPNIWYDMEWAIPSIDSIKAGLYIKIHDCKDIPKMTIHIKMLGFMNIFPDVKYYYLLSPQDTYLFIINTCDEDEESDKKVGSIYSTEHREIIHRMAEASQGIRVIRSYM